MSPLITDAETLSAGGMAKRLCDPALSDAARSGHEKIVGLSDPFTGSQRGHQGFIQPAAGPPVNILGGRLLAELGLTQQAFEPCLLALRAFGLDEQSETILKRKIVELGLLDLLLECLEHPGQLQ